MSKLSLISKDTAQREAAQTRLGEVMAENCPDDMNDYATVLRMGQTTLELAAKLEEAQNMIQELKDELIVERAPKGPKA